MTRVPALYTSKPTLSALYEDDNTLFASMTFPETISNADVGAFLLLKLGTLETVFESSSTAKTGFSIWSKALVENWTKMLEVLEAEYSPLENYSMTETMTDDETVTQYGKTSERTDNLTHEKTGTETVSPDMTEEETPGELRSTSEGVYGFNSADAVPDSETSVSITGTNTTTTSGTTETEYNTADTDTGTQTTEESGSDTETRNYTLTRAGNIGVTTSQQMLESEILLRCKWNLYEIIAAAFRREFCVSVW